MSSIDPLKGSAGTAGPLLPKEGEGLFLGLPCGGVERNDFMGEVADGDKGVLIEF